MNTEFGQLFIHHQDKARSVCRVFISKNFPEREKILGKLFGIIEIETDTADKKKYQILDNIINDLENNFYYHEKLDNLLFGKPIEEINPEFIFESVLLKLNDKIINLIQGEEIYLPINKLHFILGVLKDNYLYFTNFGQVHAFLIFEAKKGIYKLINIIESTKELSSKLNRAKIGQTKIFSNIISGKLNVGNSLLFSTSNLLDYLSLDRLKKTIITEPPNEAANSFKKILSGVSSYITFAAIIIKFVSGEVSLPKEEITLPQHSIKGLLKTEEKTKALLTPSFGTNFKRYLQIIKNFLKNLWIFLTAQKEKESKSVSGKAEKLETDSSSFFVKIKIFLNVLAVSFRNLFNLLINDFKKIGFYLKNGLGKICNFIINKKRTVIEKNKNFIWQIIKKTNLIIDYLIKKINQLPHLSKILLVTFFILIFLFTQSLVYLSKKQENEKDSTTYNQLIDQIQKKKDEAEANIIYNNENKAKNLLLEAQSLLEQLPQNTKKRKKTYNNLNKEIKVQLEKLRHIVNISEPFLIVNFASLFPEDKKINVGGLLNLDTNLYAFIPENNAFYQIDLDKRKILALDIAKDNLNPLKFGITLDQSSLLFFTENQGLAKLNLNEKIIKSLESPFGNNSEIKSLAIYNNRLYSLDTKNNQIYRHSKITNGYSPGSLWLRERGIDLTNGVSLAINGPVYVLKNNGEIYKFISGYKRIFESQSIDPPLINPKKILAPINSNFLYILDPLNKRLVVIDNDGKLKNQYYSEQFDDLKDFVVIEKEKKIFLLNGTKIFGIMANHL